MKNSGKFDDATEIECRHLIELALREDLGSSDSRLQRDITSCSVIPDHVQGSARFVSRKNGIVSGVPVCQLIVQIANRELELKVHLEDGCRVEPGQSIATISGNARDILLVERTCLNFMGRLSGIASLTARFTDLVAGTSAQILDTRKTTPGWRNLEKYAVRCGGGNNHRMGLFDAILIKDNHLAMMDILTDVPFGEIVHAISAARKWINNNKTTLPHGLNTVLEIEVDRLDQFEIALSEKPDIILLDNMTCPELSWAVQQRDEHRSPVLLEASGGVNLETVRDIALTGVDRISAGALTHSAVNFDIGLDWA